MEASETSTSEKVELPHGGVLSKIIWISSADGLVMVCVNYNPRIMGGNLGTYYL